MYAVVVALSLAIAFLMLNNIDTYYRYVRETRTTRDKITRLESETAQEKRRMDVVTQKLGTINVTLLDQQTRYINAQLAERAFSWSELLDRLEAVLPADVRIVSIAPTFDATGVIHLALQCEGKDTTGMTQTIDRFNRDSQFSNPFPNMEMATEGVVRFGLTVDYRPTRARVLLR